MQVGLRTDNSLYPLSKRKTKVTNDAPISLELPVETKTGNKNALRNVSEERTAAFDENAARDKFHEEIGLDLKEKDLSYENDMQRMLFSQRMSQQVHTENKYQNDTDKSLAKSLKALGIENEINLNADGTSELTEEQLADLREKYDVENMTQEEFNSLLTELANMNAISTKDVENQFCHTLPEGFQVMIIASDERFFEQGDNNNYWARMQRENEMFDYYLNALKNGKSSLLGSEKFGMSLYFEQQKDLSKKLFDILDLIKG